MVADHESKPTRMLYKVRLLSTMIHPKHIPHNSTPPLLSCTSSQTANTVFNMKSFIVAAALSLASMAASSPLAMPDAPIGQPYMVGNQQVVHYTAKV